MAAETLRHDARAGARGLRRITRALGPVREMDVSRAVLEDLARLQAWPAAAVARVDAHCERLRDARRAKMADALAGLDGRLLIVTLHGLADALARESPRSAASAVLTARVRQRARALARATSAAGSVYAASPLHDVRIAAKKLRYALELGGKDLAWAAAGGAVRDLRRLQTLLGRLHDEQTVQHRVREVAAAVTDRGLQRTLGTMDRALESRCRAWHGQVLKVLPQIERLTRGIVRRVPFRLGPRQVGRPARMRRDAARRRRAVGE